MREPKGFLFLDPGLYNPGTGRAVRWKNNRLAFIGLKSEENPSGKIWQIPNISQFYAGSPKKKLKKMIMLHSGRFCPRLPP
jgi:hypothetical protein